MVVRGDSATGELDDQARRKLSAFERIEADFKDSFVFVSDVHGQRRFEAFPVASSVRYLHALWICECKDRLLSVPKSIRRYEGRRCLELLRDWQAGETAQVVAFLHTKLDALPFAELTRQIQEAQRSGNTVLATRLAHGRLILLNRSFNLAQALDAIFTPSMESLLGQVRTACAEHGHAPEQITTQLTALDSPLHAYARNAALARRNMLVMNAVGVTVTDNAADRPGQRTERVRTPSAHSVPPYAEMSIIGEMTLSSMASNNPQQLDLAMPPLRVDGLEVFGRGRQATSRDSRLKPPSR